MCVDLLMSTTWLYNITAGLRFIPQNCLPQDASVQLSDWRSIIIQGWIRLLVSVDAWAGHSARDTKPERVHKTYVEKKIQWRTTALKRSAVLPLEEEDKRPSGKQNGPSLERRVLGLMARDGCMMEVENSKMIYGKLWSTLCSELGMMATPLSAHEQGKDRGSKMAGLLISKLTTVQQGMGGLMEGVLIS